MHEMGVLAVHRVSETVSGGLNHRCPPQVFPVFFKVWEGAFPLIEALDSGEIEGLERLSEAVSAETG